MTDADIDDEGDAHYKARLDVAYAHLLHQLHVKYYRRMKGAFFVLSILSGSASVLTALGGSGSPLAIGFGVVFAFVQALDLQVSPGERAAEHKYLCLEFNRLLVESKKLDADTLEEKYGKLCEDTTTKVRSIEWIAYHENLIRNGRSDAAGHLTRMQSLFRFIWL